MRWDERRTKVKWERERKIEKIGKKLCRKMRMLAKIIVHFCHDVGVYDSFFSSLLFFSFCNCCLLLIILFSPTLHCTNASHVYVRYIPWGNCTERSRCCLALLLHFWLLPLFHTSSDAVNIHIVSHTHWAPINCFSALKRLCECKSVVFFIALYIGELAHGISTLQSTREGERERARDGEKSDENF